MQFDIRLWQNVVKTTAGQTQLGHTLTQVTFKIVKNKTISSAELPSSVWLGPVQLGPNSQSCIPVAGNSFKIIFPMREHACNHNDQSWSANPQVGCVTNPLSVPNPLWRTTPPLPPRSLGCQQGHPCRQRVMEEQTSQCCAVHFNPLTPRGVRAGCAGCGQQKMEGQSFRIVCLQMFTLTDTILEGQRLAVLKMLDEEEYFFKLSRSTYISPPPWQNKNNSTDFS